MSAPRTLYDMIWDDHLVDAQPDGTCLLYIDRHLAHEVDSPQAFARLRLAGLKVRAPEKTLLLVDHNVPTSDRTSPNPDPESAAQIAYLAENAALFGLEYYDEFDKRQGICHVVGPEQGFTLPGVTLVCGDSHTATHGAFGALAFGIGTSEAEHVLATQTLVQQPARSMLVKIEGELGPLVSAKDLILAIIARIGTNGAGGHVIEYAGAAIDALDMAGRMTVCNMSIEAGARAGLIAPDDKAFAWLAGRPMAPRGAAFEQARRHWETLRSDPGAAHDRVVTIDAAEIVPMVTWGTSPETAVPVDAPIPDPADCPDPARRRQMADMLAYMGLVAGATLDGLPIDMVFIGSCTNGRIEDLRAAVRAIGGGRVAPGVRALVVPGSGEVKAQAEAEGLDRIFRDAGFEWRDPGCSMCLGMNPDRLGPAQRCASTSNRNFEGRQGPGGRTHLMSPAMAAAAAIAGTIVGPRGLAS